MSSPLKNPGTNPKVSQLAIWQADKSFTDIARPNASESEALGILISVHFEWAGAPIVEAFLAALEDANYHHLREIVLLAAQEDGAI